MVQNVLLTIEMPVLLFDKMVDAPVVRLVQVPQMQAVEETFVLPQLPLVEKSLRSLWSSLSLTRPLCVTTGTGGTAESPQLQLIDKVLAPRLMS